MEEKKCDWNETIKNLQLHSAHSYSIVLLFKQEKERSNMNTHEKDFYKELSAREVIYIKHIKNKTVVVFQS